MEVFVSCGSNANRPVNRHGIGGRGIGILHQEHHFGTVQKPGKTSEVQSKGGEGWKDSHGPELDAEKAFWQGKTRIRTLKHSAGTIGSKSSHGWLSGQNPLFGRWTALNLSGLYHSGRVRGDPIRTMTKKQ